jgi:hypothetical protein
MQEQQIRMVKKQPQSIRRQQHQLQMSPAQKIMLLSIPSRG